MRYHSLRKNRRKKILFFLFASFASRVLRPSFFACFFFFFRRRSHTLLWPAQATRRARTRFMRPEANGQQRGGEVRAHADGAIPSDARR
ncbi:hypothetical protein [Pandoravirus japonicus]|uniref:Uncharacterized protein n=1 Tax=Pandoravirus japonicus TaxID=2823154 RepID=A0A811BMG9_9VIRU|nr:hypothetical protein [Pandoravirus japonicus]